jgi:hypothetical protein
MLAASIRLVSRFLGDGARARLRLAPFDVFPQGGGKPALA